MSFKHIMIAALAMAGAANAAPAVACTPDELGDFEPTFTGPHLPGLDVTCIGVRFDGTNFLLRAETAAPITSVGDSYLVWGINRGAGIPRLQFVGAPPPMKPDLDFDAVFLPYPAQPTRLQLISPGGVLTPTFPTVEFSFTGNVLEAVLPLALLPSTGFSPWQYEFTVWSHYEPVWTGISTDNRFKANFSPTVRAVVPEPAAWAMMIFGFGAVGGLARRRRAAVAIA